MSHFENFRLMLEYMYATGMWLADSDNVTDRTWGRHIVEDWRSLDLRYQRLQEQEQLQQQVERVGT